MKNVLILAAIFIVFGALTTLAYYLMEPLIGFWAITASPVVIFGILFPLSAILTVIKNTYDKYKKGQGCENQENQLRREFLSWFNEHHSHTPLHYGLYYKTLARTAFEAREALDRYHKYYDDAKKQVEEHPDSLHEAEKMLKNNFYLEELLKNYENSSG